MILGGKTLPYPIIQGGMGVGLSLENLAGAVASCGGMGVISGANTGYFTKEFFKNAWEQNENALSEAVKKAKEIAKGKGLIGVNIMVAGQNYENMVKAALRGGADSIISGAGLPLTLPKITAGFDVLLAPIVSSARAAALICKTWHTKHGKLPDFVVIEGQKAGGHLGFSEKELRENTAKSLEKILPEVKTALEPWEQIAGQKIPVFVGGGVNTAEKIRNLLAKGADGVQIGTRFLTTAECDASPRYKEILLNAKNEDIVIMQSPVGMQARALRTPLLQKVSELGRIPPSYCVKCIQKCDPKKISFCISKALIEAVKGNYEEGLFFCGDDVDCLKSCKVSDIMDEFKQVFRKG